MKLIAYLSNGYPNLEESFLRAKRYIENGIDIIEADIPAANPYLDNDFLKARIKIARQQTVNYEEYFDAILRIQNEYPNIEIIINIYEDTIIEMGVDNFIQNMKKINNRTVLLAGTLFPDVREKLVNAGFEPSSFVTREMKNEDIELAKNSNGFVYLEGFANPDKYNENYPTLKDCVFKVRSVIGKDRKIFVGIGVHTPEQFKEVYESGADGVFLGSIILKQEDNLNKQSQLIKKLKNISIGQ
ncbi:tryptophan synthase subunit alpha [Tuanshanicoccus lijuaniae]|uniref:tryptophan synthase subunit alpha n=1 Tax=Aerococcaceae bacterium zg-1292 TaxID=2774330 RepID=UPI0019388914|nr:tryptophan synthase subunit alpha [Aerococcaceae bacterium zg-1292]QQA36617.1 tryptophan synthase subunit alpha [Aerococcaceae bacterium zg-1292]